MNKFNNVYTFMSKFIIYGITIYFYTMYNKIYYHVMEMYAATDNDDIARSAFERVIFVFSLTGVLFKRFQFTKYLVDV